MARPHDFEVTDQPKVQSWFVPAGATGPRIEIRRQFGLRPIVTADDRPVPPKWNLRAGGVFAYLALIIAFSGLVGRSSIDSLLPILPIAVAFFLVELPWLGTYKIPMRDGSTGTLRLKGARRGIRAVLNGTEVLVEPALAAPILVLSYLPTLVLFAAIFFRFAPFGAPNALGSFGPVVTGALGVIAFAGGQGAVRSPLRSGTQLIGVAALCLVVGGVELGMHYGKPEVPVGQVGTCLDLGPGSSFTRSTPQIDCQTPHRSEIIGVSVLDDGQFPGTYGLALAASGRCGDLFVTYVGSDPESSQLNLGYFAPSSDQWGLGARTVTCIAYRLDGRELTDSVRGSRL